MKVGMGTYISVDHQNQESVMGIMIFCLYEAGLNRIQLSGAQSGSGRINMAKPFYDSVREETT